MVGICLTKKQKSSAEYTAMLKEYDCTPELLDLAIYSWANKNKKMVNKDGIDLENPSLKPYLNKYFKIDSDFVFTNKRKYEFARKSWETIKKIVWTSAEKADKRYKDYVEVFGEENVIKYINSKGQTIVRVAAPILKESNKLNRDTSENPLKDLEAALLGEEISPVDKAYDKLMEVKRNVAKRIKVDGYKYIVYASEQDKLNDFNGQRAISVSKYINPEFKDLGMYGIVASHIGNTGDDVTRDFFQGKLKKAYPNLSKRMLDNLVSDLEKLHKHFKSVYGENCKIITEEFPIVAPYTVINKLGNPEVRYMVGLADMIVIDELGKYHLYDMKTKRSGVSSLDKVTYGNLLGLYSKIYGANGIEFEDTTLIHFEASKYEPPVDASTNPGNAFYRESPKKLSGKTQQIEVSRDGVNWENLLNDSMYKGPRLALYRDEIADEHTFIPVSLNTKDETMKVQFESLSKEDKELLEEEMGTPKQEKDPEPASSMRFEGRKKVEEKRGSIHNTVLSAREIHFLANSVMQNVSFMISELQTNPDANENFFGSKFAGVDFTKMSREEIIKYGSTEGGKNNVMLGHLLHWVKENIINPAPGLQAALESDEEIPDSFMNAVEKLQAAYEKENWISLVNEGYAKLIALEGITVVQAAPEDITLDYGDDGLSEEQSSAGLEEKEREYWQLGINHISAKASLSTQVRRVFERLKVLDENGEPVTDPYGFGLDTFVDPNVAVNSILQWVKDCSTVEEMEDILTEQAAKHPYLNTILEAISKEPFRSQFFRNFRKDFTQYSIITCDIDKNTGKRTYSITIVNTKGAQKTIEESLTARYKSGVMQNIIKTKDNVEGKGKVNLKEVKSIHDKAVELQDSLVKTFNRKEALKKFLDKNSKEITTLLNKLGIDVFSSTVADAISRDTKVGNLNSANSYLILSKIRFLTETLIENSNRDDYNPMLKEEKLGNIFSEYRSIASTLAKYVEDSIESSTYENGKMYYSFITPSYTGKLITQLKDSINNPGKFQKFIEDNYGKYRWFAERVNGKLSWNNTWLELLTSNKEMRGLLDHKVQLHFGKTAYKELSELGYALSLMQEYFSDPNSRYAWYRMPILANKPSSEFVKFKRYSGKGYKRTIKGHRSSNGEKVAGLKAVFYQEILRIKTVLESMVDPNISKIANFDIDTELLEKKIGKSEFRKLQERIKTKKITAKDLVTIKEAMASKGKKSGAEFHFLEALNEEFYNSESEVRDAIVDKINGKKVDEVALYDALFGANDGRDRGLIDDIMDDIVESQIRQWESMGLFETVMEPRIDKSGRVVGQEVAYKYLSNLGKPGMYGEIGDEVRAKLEEYVWNDMFATINLIQLTVTDLAYYKNMEDFQKRFAQVHSPAMRFNTEARYKGEKVSDGYHRTIYIRDFTSKQIKSEIIPNVKAIFEKKINSITDLAEKENMRNMANLIISSFEKDLNVTDAQAYSSPSAYRKKLIMAGEWTDVMEKAYERIRKGNFNVNDLGVVWQPLKPFVYSQIGKSRGQNKTMSEIKVAVQNKNSEYLLVMADALLRGDGRQSTLGAIFDFMENTANDGREVRNGKVISEGTYNGRGIDTIQFESAVKSGNMGVIDLNGLSYDEIQKRLHNLVYYNRDKSPSKNNNGDIYNDQFVHTIPFEDYGIQQEVPAHMRDHYQAMGSQVRILSVSDISDNARFKVHNWKGQEDGMVDRDYLVSRYQELHAANIKESFDDLAKQLKIHARSAKERNKALSEILQDAIKKDQRYGADLLRACSLDKDGEFIIPPCDPIQSQRIQQLINSIIKNRINKQKVKGGPVVQASVFGMSDDLHIVFNDKNGNPLRAKRSTESDEEYQKYVEDNQGSLAYMEAYIPIPSDDIERAITREDGTLMTVQEALSANILNEEMLKAICYRIPTEDKYSMIPIRIKGFLPKAAGEAIMLPKEITLLTGSDFDIDKMYVMFKEFASSTVIENYVKIKKDILSRYKKKFGDSKKDFNFADSTLAELFNGRTVTDKLNSKDKEKLEWLTEEYNKALKEHGKTKFTEITAKDKNSQSRSTRNNEIFDIQWAVLTHEDTLSKMFNPGSFDVQKKTARILSILRAGTDLSYEQLKNMSLEDLEAYSIKSSGSILFSTTQVAFHKQNMTAGKLIGIFANNNVSHAFLSTKHIHLNLKKDDSFTIGGKTVSATENNQLDRMKAFDGSLISKNIAGFLAASVDAVKDPVLNFMNLNTFTSGPAMVLARLGFDSDSIGLLMSQPIIEKLTREYFRRSNDGYVPVEDIISEELESTFEDTWRAMTNNVSATDYTKEDLAQAIKDGDTDTNYQGMVLLLFKRLSEISKHLNTLTFLTKFNSVSNSVGPTIADTLVLRERVRKFARVMDGLNPPFSPNAHPEKILGKDAGSDTILSAFYESTVGDNGASKAIFEKYFPHYSSTFEDILIKMGETTKADLDDKVINMLMSDFILYMLTSGDNPIINASRESRERFIRRFPMEFKERAAGIIDNELINIITTRSSDKKCPVATLEAKTGGYSSDMQERIKVAWSSLIENPETFELGRDLFIYNLYRSGFTFSPKTFLHLASVDVKLALGDYLKAISYKGFEMGKSLSIEGFLTQFRRNHASNPRIVPVLVENNLIGVKVKGNKLTISFDRKQKGMDSIIANKDGATKIAAPIIKYNNDIWYATDTALRGGSITYTKTTSLGNTNNFLEYNAAESGYSMESVLSKRDNSDTEDYTRKDPEPEHSKDVLPDETIDFLFNGPEAPLAAYAPEVMKIAKEKGEEAANDRTIELIKKVAEETKQKKIKEKLFRILEDFCKG